MIFRILLTDKIQSPLEFPCQWPRNNRLKCKPLRYLADPSSQLGKVPIISLFNVYSWRWN